MGPPAVLYGPTPPLAMSGRPVPPADALARLLDATHRIQLLVADAVDAPTRHAVQEALKEIVGAYRTTAQSAQPAAASSDGAFRALYTRTLLLHADRPSVPALREALVALVEALDADAGALVVLDEEGATERVIAHRVEEAEVRAASAGVIERVRQLRKGVNIESVAEHQSLAVQTSLIRAGLHAALCVPLLARGSVWGAVYVDRRRSEAPPFGQADLDVVGVFGQQVASALRLAHRLDRLEAETTDLRARVEGRLRAPQLLGRSAPMLRLLDRLAAVADTDATVLITGESGTGKELVARTLHANSKRADGPFVAVNCGAIPDSLLESTLFGHKKGAFTGAVADEEGLIASAAGGTLFLDEIGDMPPALQVKLLRVLQTGTYTRVGDTAPRRADVRWVAATHRDLPERIKAGDFREDLYYRLAVFDLAVPPLRERRDDVGPLASHFVRRFAEEHGRPALTLSADALAALEAHPWPGNVRELENVVQRAVILSETPTITSDLLPPSVAGDPEEDDEATGGMGGYHEAVRLFKRRLLREALEAHDGSRTGAAGALGLNRTYLSRLLRQLDLQDEGV